MVPSLITEDGQFRKQSQLLSGIKISLDELEEEWTAQIERFLASGLVPTHLDSHHHVHTQNEIQPVVQKLAAKYRLPVRRNGVDKVEGVSSFSDVALFDFYGDGVNSDYFSRLAERLDDGVIAEIMCHPAYLDHFLMKSSSYNLKRLEEFEILTTVSLPENIVLL
jgi:predicted glycoside hydrolase/deacetylase ChbG (UPF0249 family)